MVTTHWSTRALLLVAALGACAAEPEPKPWYPAWLDNPVEYPLGEVAKLSDAELGAAVEFSGTRANSSTRQ